MKNARHTTKTGGRVIAHLPAALVLCASAAVPLTGVRADRGPSTGALRLTAGVSRSPVEAAFVAPLARPVFLRAEHGPTALVRGADGRVLGWIRDRVLLAGTGRITHVVLATEAGRDVLVPARRFAWDPQKKELWLAAGPAELSDGSEYDPAELQRLEGPAWNVAGVFQAGRTSNPREETPRNSGCNVLASEVVQRPLTVQGRPFGVVEALLVDPLHGEVAYLLVAPRAPAAGLEPGAEAELSADARSCGECLLIPWFAVALDHSGSLELALTEPRLASAPTIPADLVPLGNPGFLASVDRFYRSSDTEAGD